MLVAHAGMMRLASKSGLRRTKPSNEGSKHGKSGKLASKSTPVLTPEDEVANGQASFAKVSISDAARRGRDVDLQPPFAVAAGTPAIAPVAQGTSKEAGLGQQAGWQPQQEGWQELQQVLATDHRQVPDSPDDPEADLSAKLHKQQQLLVAQLQGEELLEEALVQGDQLPLQQPSRQSPELRSRSAHDVPTLQPLQPLQPLPSLLHNSSSPLPSGAGPPKRHSSLGLSKPGTPSTDGRATGNRGPAPCQGSAAAQGQRQCARSNSDNDIGALQPRRAPVAIGRAPDVFACARLCFLCTRACPFEPSAAQALVMLGTCPWACPLCGQQQ